jgi:transcriptional regulator NrdR family protein
VTDSHTCPNCDGRMRFSRVRTHETFTERRRECCKCGHRDKVHVRIREEVVAIIDVAKRSKKLVRKRTRPTKKHKA